MTESHLLYWPFLLVFVLVAYWLPGHAAMQLMDVHGLGRVGRLLFAFPISLIVLPYMMVTLGNLVHLKPNVNWLLGFSTILFGVSWLLRRFGLIARFELYHCRGDASPIDRREAITALIFALGFAALVSLPRLDLLVHGDQAGVVLTYDEFWHQSELVSVARSGIPPRHYFFPDLPLVYYYWSWVYPATIANNSILYIPLARALAVHEFLQVAVFIGTVYLFMCHSLRSRLARVLGIAFLTVMGGFDLFNTMNVDRNEWWQKHVSWLVSPNQVSSFVTLYMWVPQHLAGGMAFVLALFLWRHVRASAISRSIALGMLISFTLGTSAFVFLGAVLALLMWTLFNWRLLVRRSAIAPIALFVATAGLAGWHQIMLTLVHPGSLIGSDLRVPLLESYFNAQTLLLSLLDRGLTILALPVVLGWIMLIEMGLPFALYLLWLFQCGWRNHSDFGRIVVLFPLSCLAFIALFKDERGGGNLAMRMLIPAQIMMGFAAAWYADRWRWSRWGGVKRVVFIYLFAILVACQSVSWFTDWYRLSRVGIGGAFSVQDERRILGIAVAIPSPWPESLAYIPWLNRYSPADALVVEDRAPTLVKPQYVNRFFRLLERMRFMMPAEVSQLPHARSDLELTIPKYLDRLDEQLADGNITQHVLKSDYVRSRDIPIYYVSRQGSQGIEGRKVYEDTYVTIYLLSSFR